MKTLCVYVNDQLENGQPRPAIDDPGFLAFPMAAGFDPAWVEAKRQAFATCQDSNNQLLGASIIERDLNWPTLDQLIAAYPEEELTKGRPELTVSDDRRTASLWFYHGTVLTYTFDEDGKFVSYEHVN